MEMASRILGQLAIWRIVSKNLIQAWLCLWQIGRAAETALAVKIDQPQQIGQSEGFKEWLRHKHNPT